jgi:hypothetical protein
MRVLDGVTGPGRRITTMDPDITVTDALEREMQEIERWLRNPNPTNDLYGESPLELVLEEAGIGLRSSTAIQQSHLPERHEPLSRVVHGRLVKARRRRSDDDHAQGKVQVHALEHDSLNGLCNSGVIRLPRTY